MKFRKLINNNWHGRTEPPPQLFLVLLIILNLVIAWNIAPDFGRTADERVESLRASAALRAYTPGSFGKYSDNDIPVASRYYGTALTMLAQAVELAFKDRANTDAGVLIHYSYFVIFQVAVVSMFYLTRKISSGWTALITAILFSTQPLLFGHAFNNPKDIPLLTIFLATVTAGIYITDKLEKAVGVDSNKGEPRLDIQFAWKTTTKEDKKNLLRLQWVWPLILTAYFIISFLIPLLITKLFEFPPESPIRKVLTQLLEQPSTLNLPNYIAKATKINNQFFLILTGLALVIIISRTINTITALKTYLLDVWGKPIINDFRPKVLNRHLTNIGLLFSGFLFGICISTRVMGIFAGGVVGLYMVMKIGKRAVVPIGIYTITSAVTAYLAWPQFWVRGFQALFNGLGLFSSFFWDNPVLYNGVIYKASQLPRTYLLFFLVAQFTVPVIIFSGVGILKYFSNLRKNHNSQMLLAIAFWIVLPVFYVLIKHPKLYNNCRQFLFITPPIFVFFSYGFDAVIKRIKPDLVQLLFALVVLLPGIVALFQLHPYQYIYYNEFVGGVEGAFRKYEMDYYSASSTEAIEYLNQISPKNSSVIVWGVSADLEFFAREDITIIKQKEIDEPISNYDFAIILTQFNADLNNLESRPTIYSIEREGAILAVIKEINNNP